MMSMFLPLDIRRFKVGDKVKYKFGSQIHKVVETGWKHATPTIRLKNIPHMLEEYDFELVSKTVGFEITDD